MEKKRKEKLSLNHLARELEKKMKKEKKNLKKKTKDVGYFI